MQDPTPKIKFYGKSELAEMYGISVTTLSNWIHRNRELKEKLILVGFHKHLHVFTPKHVELIFHYLSEPEFIPKHNLKFSCEKVKIKPMNIKEIANLYEITATILRNVLKLVMPEPIFQKIHEVPQDERDFEINFSKRLFTKDDVELIFSFLGEPFIYKK